MFKPQLRMPTALQVNQSRKKERKLTTNHTIPHQNKTGSTQHQGKWMPNEQIKNGHEEAALIVLFPFDSFS